MLETSVLYEVIDEAGPRLAVISVDKNNRFGYSTREVLGMLASKGVKTVRTDTKGVRRC